MNAMIGVASRGSRTMRGVRCISARAKRARYAARNAALKEEEQSTLKDLPKFQTLMRAMYRKVHPDLLKASHPELSKVNDSSMQILNSVITSIKKYNDFPPQIVKSIPFYIIDDGEARLLQLRILTAGGECQKSLTKSFAGFFAEAGILMIEDNNNKTPAFIWDKDFFPKEESEYSEEDSPSVMNV
jgi:hypothetical protein